MKKGALLIFLSVLLVISTNIQAEDEITIKLPFAFQDKFQPGSQHLGFPKGNVLQVGCFIKPGSAVIKKVTATNLSTGLVLPVSPKYIGNVWSGLYLVYPFPQFDPAKHMGEWELSVKDERGKETKVRTHNLNIHTEMPYIEGIKVSGDPTAPLISWAAPAEQNVHENCEVKYEVRLLTDMDHHFHKSRTLSQTSYQVPEGLIDPNEISKVYIRIDTQGYDKTDKEHFLPLEQKSQTFISLQTALGKS